MNQKELLKALNASPGLSKIIQERSEQIHVHGRTIKEDYKSNKWRQLQVAASGIIRASNDKEGAKMRFKLMPSSWVDDICRKMCRKSYLERLAIAGALIAAEIDRVTVNKKG